MVNGPLMSTVIDGCGDLHEVITMHVSHDGIDYAIALPHDDRTSENLSISTPRVALFWVGSDM